MAIEFLSDDQVAAYGRFAGAPERAELERFFFLDDADRVLIEQAEAVTTSDWASAFSSER